MQGYVRTPDALVASMVRDLFAERTPRSEDVLLDPGCGDGAFLSAVVDYCQSQRLDIPQLIGIEIDEDLSKQARKNLRGSPTEIRNGDFLLEPLPSADYVVGNPPYVALPDLTKTQRRRYRESSIVASGRYDLYMLFFHRSMQLLKPGGRLVFVTPEKYQYVSSGEALRVELAARRVSRLKFLDPETFPGRITYPVVTIVDNAPPGETRIERPDGAKQQVTLPRQGSWGPSTRLHAGLNQQTRLADVCVRISCGVATGRDDIFIARADELPGRIRPFSHPTVSGKQLNGRISVEDAILCPYDKQGKLLGEEALGALREWFVVGGRERVLRERSCVKEGKRAWYAFHDSFPIQDLLKPKLLFKDICREPHFLVDPSGKIVPRHSVYYAVPKPGVSLDKLAGYLNSPVAQDWLKANSQRAAQGYYRLQSHVLKELPVPDSLRPGEKA